MSFARGDHTPEIGKELGRVRDRIGEEVALGGPVMRSRLQELFSRDAKLLRPTFTILAARIQNGGEAAPERVINIAAAIEMLHVASLIHDDIVDNARSRRGGPALHLQYGPRDAVLMGDFLFARCFTTIAEYATAENARFLTAAVSRIINAEIDEYATNDHLSVRAYLRRIVGKTAVLFAASFHLGSSEAGDDTRVTQALRRIGYNIGVAFQIIDDILDVAGQPSRMGKPGGTDLKSGVITLPAILAMRDDGKVGRSVLRLVSSHSGIVRTVNASRIRRAVLSGEGLDEARSWAAQYTARAERELASLPQGPDAETLNASIQRLLQRSA